ncbi:type II CAAX endopeptidase family protein [Phenylobacterium sp.]|uniref:type II CAAX endopeptidase family protein n=1 Tax=Phenylobacterium sp. TaxID=1871053 RepID=UPI0025F1A7D8|nr:type II CAAX endopeptidase family protein [Phenylobacterium sp.]
MPGSSRAWSAPASILIGFVYIAGYGVLYLGATMLSALALPRLAPGAPKWAFSVSHGVLWIASVALVTWLMRSKLNRRPWAGMATPLPPTLGRFPLGFVAGAALLLAVFAVQFGLGWLRVTGIDSLSMAWPRAALGLFPSLGVGFCEEIAFRGYILQTLGERMPAWAAVLLTALIFALFHFTLGGFGPGFVVTVMGLSLVFTILRFATGSLWFPMGLHAAWDWTQTFLVGVGNVGARPGHDPALVHVAQGGPGLWVGQAPSIEGGLIYALAAAAALAAAWAYAAARGRLPRWGLPLRPDGTQ